MATVGEHIGGSCTDSIRPSAKEKLLPSLLKKLFGLLLINSKAEKHINYGLLVINGFHVFFCIFLHGTLVIIVQMSSHSRSYSSAKTLLLIIPETENHFRAHGYKCFSFFTCLLTMYCKLDVFHYSHVIGTMGRKKW